ncbi:unnamed protein product [Prorocentrum cordatum]|uniref:Subtilisin n=1 Tax=Prorocentrum cordatum TaxID=2364126 RepID=A0ABN9X743_9DINO|nr:unnamed protein product [Polarella glacialis]
MRGELDRGACAARLAGHPADVPEFSAERQAHARFSPRAARRRAKRPPTPCHSNLPVQHAIPAVRGREARASAARASAAPDCQPSSTAVESEGQVIWAVGTALLGPSPLV